MTDLAEIQSEQKPAWFLRRAVLIYFADEGDAFGSRRQNSGVYATLHNVGKDKSGLTLGSGVPATKEACADLARGLGAASTLSGFIPQNLLYLGARTLAWWRPPGSATMHFNAMKSPAGDQPQDVDHAKHAKALGKRGGVAQQPGLVFVVTPGDWYVYAIAGAERPTAATKILRAPYFNVWSSGRICTGNVQLPETLSPAALDQYERAFFGSEFTHPNVHGRERLVDWPDGPYEFWRMLLAPRAKAAFPLGALVPVNRSLGKLLEQIEEGRLRDD